MTIAELGSMGEFVGSIAVVLTLGYLAGQVKYAKSEARRALSQGRAEAIRELIKMGCDDRINRLVMQANDALGLGTQGFLKELMDKCGLTREEARLLLADQGMNWAFTLHMISNLEDLPPMERHEFERVLRLRYPPGGIGRLYYGAIRSQVHPSVVKYLDGILEAPA
jgi:hypothetical protein